ncbi:MAG: imidazole glycerol phosphate synthase subunit HisH [Spirochaetales bacterium]|jgi:glutamine amidotransferase|nr:imidazole glycerol phosphate synthase subunit HisH [Spirochaetales bacterium]
MVGIIDSKICNIESICNLIRKLGASYTIVDSCEKFEGINRLILPGVGAFARAMENLEKHKLLDGILAHAAAGKPMLGICLGMQLLFESSEEFGHSKGLGLIPGNVVKINTDMVLPHMGWNDLKITQEIPLLKDIPQDSDVYFVHSFRADTESKYIAASAQYGETVPAVVFRDNVMGTQFHPEKSLKWGEKIMTNFFNM